MNRKFRAKPPSPFRCFNSSPEVIRLAVLMYVKDPLSLRNLDDLLHERGIDTSHETVRFWWNRFGPLFAADIRRQRVGHKGRLERNDPISRSQAARQTGKPLNCLDVFAIPGAMPPSSGRSTDNIRATAGRADLGRCSRHNASGPYSQDRCQGP